MNKENTCCEKCHMNFDEKFDKLAEEAHFSSDPAIAFRLEKIKLFFHIYIKEKIEEMEKVRDNYSCTHATYGDGCLCEGAVQTTLDTAINIFKDL
jgi:hypothetical protein